MSGDELRTALAAIAIAISLASLYFSRRSWLQSNRPIVTAFVSEYSSGPGITVFNLVVSNSGNRPAVGVQLLATSQDIESIIDEKAQDQRKEAIRRCFSKDAAISLLRNGEELKTAFGGYFEQRPDDVWLKYEREIEIEVRYLDLEGKRYRARMPLKIFAREGFAGSVWQKQV